MSPYGFAAGQVSCDAHSDLFEVFVSGLFGWLKARSQRRHDCVNQTDILGLLSFECFASQGHVHSVQ